VWLTEVLSYGQLEQWGKTEHSTRRRTALPSLLREDLDQWREILTAFGHPARDIDFIVPGDLTNARQDVRDPKTGVCHFSGRQAKTWGQRCFTPAVQAVAKRSEFARILGATPYALRRGSTSLRLRTEDPQTVASECDTSLKMLSDHYSFPIEDLRQQEPRPPDVEWRAARVDLLERHTQEQALTVSPTPERTRPHRKLSADGAPAVGVVAGRKLRMPAAPRNRLGQPVLLSIGRRARH